MRKEQKGTPVAKARLSREKRRLGISAAIAVGVLSLGSGVYYAGDYYYTDRDATKTKMQTEKTTVTSQMTQRESDAKEAASAIQLYGLLMRSNGVAETGAVDFSLDRDVLTARLSDLRAKHFLQDLQLNAQAPQTVASGLAKLQNGKEVSMQVELTAKAWSDQHLASFLTDLTTSLPGFVELQEYSMVKDGEITPEVILSAARGERAALVTAKIRFVWRGIQPNPKAPVSTSPTPGAPSGTGTAPSPGATPPAGAAPAAPLPQAMHVAPVSVRVA